MSRILMLAVAVLVLVWLLRRALTARKRGPGAARQGSAPAPAPELVACAHCGVHLPKSEALAAPGGGAVPPSYFCSTEHQQLGPR